MYKYLLTLILVVLFCGIAQARDTVDGYESTEQEVSVWSAIGTPSVSATNTGRVYYNGTSDTLKLSVNGGAYSDLLTLSSGGSSFLLLDQTPAQTLDASPAITTLTSTYLPHANATKQLVNSNMTTDGTNFTTTGDITCDALNYTTLNPPVDLSAYAKLDGTNQPFTGNLNVSKADPEIRLTDSGNSEYARLTKSDTTNTFTIKNRTLSVSYGGAIYSNGGANAKVTSSSVLGGSGDFSLVAWIKVETLTSYPYCLALGTNTSSWGANIFRGSGLNCFSIVRGGSQYNANFSAITDSEWHLLIGVRNGTNIYSYVDGNTTPINTTAVGTGTIRSDINAFIGAGAGERLVGTIDGVLIYNIALSSSDITSIWNAGAGTETPPLSGLTLQWNFNDGSGLTIGDSSGNGYNGTIASPLGDISWVSGKIQTTGTMHESDIITSTDGVITSGVLQDDYALNIFGNSNSKTILDGSMLCFYTGGAEYGRVDSLGKWNFTKNSSLTNTIQEMQRLTTTSTGTVAANFGASLDTYLEDASGNTAQQASSIATIWTTPTHASETSAITFSTVTSGGAITEAMRIYNKNVNIGTTDISATTLSVVDDGLDSNDIVKIRSTSNSTWSSLGLWDLNNAQKGSFGYGNPGAPTYAGVTFFQSAANTDFAIGAGGAEVIRIKSTGNVGIGTTDFDGTPAIGRLTVKGSTNDGSTNIFVGRDSDEANVATLDTNGNLTTLGVTTGTYFQTSTAITANSTGTVAIVAKDAAAGTNNAGWMPIKKSDGTVVYIPYWS